MNVSPQARRRQLDQFATGCHVANHATTVAVTPDQKATTVFPGGS
jgi:hypothetical protein